MPHARVVIISGPSGAGKTTIVKGLLKSCRIPMKLSVSATTRPIRPAEVDGVDYHFMTHDEFIRRRSNGDFLESFEVFGRGYWYGTLRSEVETSLARGEWALLEIDVNGMKQVIAQYPDAITIFVRPASLAELERRLRQRGTDSEETIRRRLAVAQQEWEQKESYIHDVVNEDVETAIDEISRLLQREFASK